MKALLEEPEGGARMSAFMHDTLLGYHIFIYWLGESTCSCIEQARPILEGQNLTFYANEVIFYIMLFQYKRHYVMSHSDKPVTKVSSMH